MKTTIETVRIAHLFSRKTFALLCSATLLAAFASGARAATTLIWTGGGGDGLWNDAANWNPNTLIGIDTNDVLEFNGTAGLGNTNNINGVTNAGIVFLPGAGAFTLNAAAGVTTYMNGNIGCQSTNLETLNLSLKLTGSRDIEPENGINAAGIVFNGAISQAASSGLSFYPAPAIYAPGQGLANNGGTVTFNAANTFSGETFWGGSTSAGGYSTNEGGPTVILNFAAPGAPQNNILFNGAASPVAVSMGGGNLVMQGGPDVTNVQTVGTVNMQPGFSVIQVIDGAGTGNAVLQVGEINTGVNGNYERECTYDFILPAGIQSTNNGITTPAIVGASTPAVDPNIGIFTTSPAGRHFADFVVNGTDWATLGGASGTNIVPYTGYLTDLTTAYSNQDVVASGTVMAAPEPGAGVAAMGTLRFNTPAPITLTITNQQGLYGGAILVTPNCGDNIQTIAGTNGPGSELWGNSFNGAEGLNIMQFNTNAPLVLTNLAVLDGGQLNICGGGEVIMGTCTNPSTANPCVSIMGGELTIYQNDSLGKPTSGGGIQINNGTLCAATTMALDANNGGGLDAREIALGNLGGTFSVLGTNTLTVSGTFIEGNSAVGASGGSVAKTGPGTLMFTASDAYPAPTYVEQGTLVIAGGLSGNSAMVVSDGTTLVDQGNVSITPGVLYLGSTNGCTNTFTSLSSTTTAPIRTGTLDAGGTNIINVGGNFAGAGIYPLISFTNNTGAGGFVVGTLPIGVAANIITNTTATNASIALNVTSIPIPVVWKGNINNNWDDMTANWVFNGNSSTYSDGDPAQFDDTADLFNVNLAANVSPGSIYVTNSQNAYTFSGSDGILAGSLTKAGTNSLTLAVTDSSGGVITVNAGTLVVGDGTTNGAVTGGTIVDDSVVEFSETNGDCFQPISGSGTVEVNAANNVGSGDYTMGGANSYLGNTIIEAGQLNVGNATTIPAEAGGGILAVNTNTVLNVNGMGVTVNGLSGNGTVDNQAAGAVTFTVGANNTNSTFAGTISNTVGAVGLSKNGTGTLFLTGTNYFVGTLTFNGGIVNAASFSDYADAGTANSGPSAIGLHYYSNDAGDDGQYDSSGTVGLLFQGGTLQYTGSTPQESDRNIRIQNGVTATIDASGSNPGATLYWSFGDVVGPNADLFETPGTRTLQLSGSNTGTNTFDIQVTDQAANSTAVTKSGAGTWYMLGASAATPPGNYYSGLTTVSGGNLFISTTHNDYQGSVPPVGVTGSAADSDGLGPFSISDGATLGVIYGGDSADYPALMGTLTVGSSAGGKLEFLNIPGSQPMVKATNTVFHGTGTIICATNNLAQGTYPLLAYGKLSGSYSLATMPGPFYYALTNDGVNIDLEVATTPFVNTNPTNIVFTVANGQMTLSWPADHIGWQLQAQTNSVAAGIGTNWVDVSGSTTTDQMTVPINPGNGCVFYRLMYP